MASSWSSTVEKALLLEAVLSEGEGVVTLGLHCPRFENRTAVERLAEHIRLAVQNGVYVAGDKLPPERALAEQFGVARPTLRQALNLLKAERYIESRQGAMAGTFVTDLTVPTSAWLRRMKANVRELDDIFEYNVMVETTAAAIAAERRSEADLEEVQLAIDQLRVLVQLHKRGQKPNGGEYAPLRGADTMFHQSIALASRNRRIVETVFRARGELFTAALLVMYDDVLLAQIQAEHEAVLAAIRDGDPSAARRAMDAHIRNGRMRLKALLDAQNEPPASSAGS